MTPPHDSSSQSTNRFLKSWRDVIADNRLGQFSMILFGIWLCAADALVVATIMPTVSSDLNGHTWLSWAVGVFMFGGILAGSSAGKIAEWIGLQHATVMAGVIFTLGTLIDALAPDIQWFLLGRLFQGVGAGWISGFIMVAIAFIFPKRHLARVFTATTSVWGIATLIGPLLGAYVTELSDWRAVFWLFAVQGVIFCGASYYLLRTTKTEKGTGIPWRQLLWLVAAIASLAIANVFSELDMAINWRISLSITCLIVCASLVGYLLIKDRNLPVRLLPANTCDSRSIPGLSYLTMFCLIAASMAFTTHGPALLQQNFGLSILQAGYVIGSESIAWTLAAFYAARFDAPNHIGNLIRGGACCVLLGSVLLTVTMHGTALYPIVVAGSVLGTGFGLLSAHINRQVFASLAKDDLAIGSSAVVAVRQFGSAFAAAIAGIAANIAGWNGLQTSGNYSNISGLPQDAVSIVIFGSLVPFAIIGFWSAFRLANLIEPQTYAMLEEK